MGLAIRITDGTLVQLESVAEPYYGEDTPLHHITATVDGETVGDLYADMTTRTVLLIEVLPEWQRMGIASAMFHYGQARHSITHQPDRECTEQGRKFKAGEARNVWALTTKYVIGA